MRSVIVVCSTNYAPNQEPSDRERKLQPLITLLEFLSTQNVNLERLMLIGGNGDSDGIYYSDVCTKLRSQAVVGLIAANDHAPGELATVVSQAAAEARANHAELWVDLTPGPKNRTAVLYAAASAVPGVRILYAEHKQGRYVIGDLPPLSTFNSWLARHGIMVRNYANE